MFSYRAGLVRIIKRVQVVYGTFRIKKKGIHAQTGNAHPEIDNDIKCKICHFIKISKELIILSHSKKSVVFYYLNVYITLYLTF